MMFENTAIVFLFCLLFFRKEVIQCERSVCCASAEAKDRCAVMYSARQSKGTCRQETVVTPYAAICFRCHRETER